MVPTGIGLFGSGNAVKSWLWFPLFDIVRTTPLLWLHVDMPFFFPSFFDSKSVVLQANKLCLDHTITLVVKKKWRCQANLYIFYRQLSPKVFPCSLGLLRLCTATPAAPFYFAPLALWWLCGLGRVPTHRHRPQPASTITALYQFQPKSQKDAGNPPKDAGNPPPQGCW